MVIPKEFSLVFSRIKERRELILGVLAAFGASVISAFIPYIYGRLRV